MASLQSISSSMLVAAIERARTRIVLIAPGVWPDVANCVAEAWQRLGPGNVVVVLDVDAEVCRYGFGSMEGLEVLQKVASEMGESIGHESGVRISVVIADDETFVFSPTPKQLEAAPEDTDLSATSRAKVNGIVLSNPPASLERELGVGLDQEADRTIGLDPLSEEKLGEVTQDLKQNPPKNFDLSKAVNVYNSKIRFVELKVTGCSLSRQSASLPKHLIKVLKGNTELGDKIENSIQLLDDKDKLINDPELSEATIQKKREDIEEEFFVLIPHIGSVLRRSDIPKFEEAFDELNSSIDTFAEQVEAGLRSHFTETAQKLADEILPDVMLDMPDHWRRRVGIDPDHDRVRWMIIDDLEKAFGDPMSRTNKMAATKVYKDVTYEMLIEPKFISLVAEKFPELNQVEEYSALPEQTKDQLDLGELYE